MAEELLVGRTKIGTSPRTILDTGEIIEFEVYYGNVLLPLVEGEVKHLPDKEYIEILAKFLSSEQGAGYRVPTTEEIAAASQEMYNREIAIRNKQQAADQTNSNPDPENSHSDAEEVAEDKNMSDTSNGATAERDEQLKAYKPNRDLALEEATANSMESANNGSQEEEDDTSDKSRHSKSDYQKNKYLDNQVKQHPNPSYERLYRALVKKQSRVSGLRIALIVFVILFAASAFGLYYLLTNFYNLLENKNAELKINGETYTMPLDLNEIELENGQSEFYVFGISIKKDEEGNIHQSIIPFGQLNETYDITETVEPNTDAETTEETSDGTDAVTDEESEHTVIPAKDEVSSGQIKVSGE